MGYRMYTGRLQVNPEDYTFSWNGKTLFYSTEGDAVSGAEETPMVRDPELKLTANDPGELTFTVPYRSLGADGVMHDNLCNDSFMTRKDFVSVEEDGAEIFFGYVKQSVLQFDRSREITVCGIEQTFEDVEYLLEPKVWNVTTQSGSVSRTDDLIGHFMPQLAMPGDADNTMPIAFDSAGCDVAVGKTVDTSDEGWQSMTFANVVQTYLLDEYGGYFRVEKTEVSPGRYRFVIRYTKDGSGTTSQTVEYGKNLLDLTVTEEINDIVNIVLVCGVVSKTRGWWIFKRTTTEYLYGYAQDKTSVARYGAYRKIVMNDQVGSTEECEKLAAEELAKQDHYDVPEIEVRAYDRVDAGMQTDRLGFLKKTRILSEPHGVDGVYLCTRETIPLDDPGSKEFYFGVPPVKLSKKQNQLFAASAALKRVTKGILANVGNWQGVGK